jgi:methylmalonyl-CoA/ethylmalonyl-CoA epimerase
MGEHDDDRDPTAAPPYDHGPGYAGIDHVGVLVRDLDAAIGLYVERLGMPLVGIEDLAEVGVRLAYVDAGNALIQLVQPSRSGPLVDELVSRGEGIHHLCLSVADIPTALARLAPGAKVPIVLGGRGRRACFLPDRPGGLRVELTELRPWAEREAGSTTTSTEGET